MILHILKPGELTPYCGKRPTCGEHAAEWGREPAGDWQRCEACEAMRDVRCRRWARALTALVFWIRGK